MDCLGAKFQPFTPFCFQIMNLTPLFPQFPQMTSYFGSKDIFSEICKGIRRVLLADPQMVIPYNRKGYIMA